jgi:hypothetical protein
MAQHRRRLAEGDPKAKCFREDTEGTLWFKERIVVLKKEALKKKIWMRPIHRSTPFILAVPRCTMV